jgi:predicted amino acid dehydrogenase
MEVKHRQADIVIIASAHNPSIIAPQWLKDKSLIVEAG